MRSKVKPGSSSDSKRGKRNISTVKAAVLISSFIFSLSYFLLLQKWSALSIQKQATMTSGLDNNKSKTMASGSSGSDRKLAQLSCAEYGGPSDAAASEMVYWEDIEINAKFISPFKRKDTTQYLTFEPDRAGFNNVRMGVETVVALAHAMGKTLVVPPDRNIRALDSSENEQKNSFSIDEILHLDSIKIEHPGLNIISMEEFLSEVAIKEGKFKKPNETQALYPPNNKTKWDSEELLPLWEYLRTIGLLRQWKPGKCVVLFPSSPDKKYSKQLDQLFNETVNYANGRSRTVPSEFDGKPVSVDAPAQERLRDVLGRRRNACSYDKEMRDASLLHFKEDYKEGFRLLTHFYGFIFFQDWRQDLWTKRFIRDHVRYTDEIFCAAARVVDAIRKRAKRKQPETNPNGDFDTLHVRRNDFVRVGKRQVISSEELFNNTKNELTHGSTVFIATDERDKEYFRPMIDVYDVVFLDNFKEELGSLNTNFYAFVDQLVAARGKVFFGCFSSTFTGYINRLRGYYSVKEERDGFQDGVIESYHYTKARHKYLYRTYHAFQTPAFAREYPTAWRDLDYGIDALDNAYSRDTKPGKQSPGLKVDS